MDSNFLAEQNNKMTFMSTNDSSGFVQSSFMDDMWVLDTKFVPVVVAGDRSKKKDLTGAVWSQTEYKVKTFDDQHLDPKQSALWFSDIQLYRMEKSIFFGVKSGQQSEREEMDFEFVVLKLEQNEKNESMLFRQLGREGGAFDFDLKNAIDL